MERGFDFLGHHISPEGLSLSNKTVENFIERSARLYEQEPREPYDSARLGLYVKRWCRWTQSGLGEERRNVRRNYIGRAQDMSSGRSVPPLLPLTSIPA
ncbi:MAG: hypothetical protein ACERKJ_12255 [Candidatus Dadabacteria bacterium]